MVQTSEDRFREYERTRPQSMSGLQLRNWHGCSRRVGYARLQPAV